MVQTPDRFPGEDVDDLLEYDPDDTSTTYAVTRDASGRVSDEVWTDTATALELKRIIYTYDVNDRVATEVRKVFDPTDGVTVRSQKTLTYSYSNDAVTGATVVRDV